MSTITAFAPASVGNVGVGFDILGHAIEGVGDTVTLRRRAASGMAFARISGVITELPRDVEANAATRPLLSMARDFGIEGGLEIELNKGIPLGSGMGGSAASAVAAVVAADALWELGLERQRLLAYALEGESVASGAAHADNAAASLFGGLVLTEPGPPLHCTVVPVPADVACVLCHPELEVRTRDARQILSDSVPRQAFVRQSGWLAGFVAGCLRGDLDQVARCLRDEIIWPQRARLVPGAVNALEAARQAGAFGGSLSGSGPSVFAWTRRDNAEAVARSMTARFEAAGIPCEHWISTPNAPGARVLRGA
ncbi:MAG: homoserine kinase [Gammaproteobacteria bacterium]|jgi:homoserine kinase